VAGRILLGDDTDCEAVHTAADQVRACWNLEFDWSALYAHTRVMARVLKSDLCKVLQRVSVRAKLLMCGVWS